MFLSIAVIAGASAYLWARTLPEYYESMINCVPPRVDPSASAGALGGISSALKDVGLSKLGGKTDTYEFMALLFSRSLRDSIVKRFRLAEEYDMTDRPRREILEEFETNLEINLRAEGNYEISIMSRDPNKAVAMCRAFVEEANDLSNRIAREEAHRTTTYLEKRIGAIDSTMTVLSSLLGTYSSKTLMFAPEQQAQAAATSLSELQAQVMREEIVADLFAQQFGEADAQTESKRMLVASLRKKLQEFQNSKGFIGEFSLREATSIGVPYMRMVAEYEALGKVKAFLIPSLEQARLDQTKNTPSLLVMDDPIKADRKSKPKRALIAVGTAVGSVITVVLFILLQTAWRSLHQSTKS